MSIYLVSLCEIRKNRITEEWQGHTQSEKIVENKIIFSKEKSQYFENPLTTNISAHPVIFISFALCSFIHRNNMKLEFHSRQSRVDKAADCNSLMCKS